MIWLQNVPNYEWVYIHAGVSKKDTRGCPLVGFSSDVDMRKLAKSRMAYCGLYLDVSKALYDGSLRVVVTNAMEPA